MILIHFKMLLFSFNSINKLVHTIFWFPQISSQIISITNLSHLLLSLAVTLTVLISSKRQTTIWCRQERQQLFITWHGCTWWWSNGDGSLSILSWLHFSNISHILETSLIHCILWNGMKIWSVPRPNKQSLIIIHFQFRFRWTIVSHTLDNLLYQYYKNLSIRTRLQR